MYCTFTIIFSFFCIFCHFQEESFREQQKRYSRVRVAYDEKYELLRNTLETAGISNFNTEIFIRAFKQEQILEVWVRDKDSPRFVFFKEYRICRISGEPGPKRRQGDFQIPEGFYHITHFNPYSNFFLSLGINYPNASDRILSYQPAPGGDIYIHGSCVTIGCIPLTDDKIKELYVLTVEARTNGQDEISVHIYPSKLNGESWDNLITSYHDQEDLIHFWNQLKTGYDYFESYRQLPHISVASNGDYIIR